MATLTNKTVIRLGMDAPSPHLFRQTVGRSVDKRIPLAEENNHSRGFATFPAALKIAIAVPRQRVDVVRCGAGCEVIFCCFKVKLGEISCMFYGLVDLLALATPLSWGDLGKVPTLPVVNWECT